MKALKLKFLKWILRTLAIWTVKKYQPGVIGITGSVGKTSTKEAILAVMRSIRRVRASSGNFNNEIGLPLTVLGDWDQTGGLIFWIKVICRSFLRLMFSGTYPEILILEYAADRPGDIKYLLEIVKPQISVVTAIGDIPTHVEYYSGPDAVAREKSRLVETLPTIGFAVLNYDDEAVFDMKDRTRANVVTYGYGDGAQVRITNFENRSENRRPLGITFKLEHGSNFVPVRMEGVFGKTQGYAAAAAAAVGLSFGMNLVRVAEALSYYQAPAHRMKMIPGVKGSYVIDDTYNASPLSMRAAIETAKSLRATRRIGVLGDMLEIGKYTIEAHEMIGRLSAKVFDILVTVGARAKFIAEAAHKAGLPKKSIHMYETADEAKLAVQQLIKKGDMVLVKASHGIQLDKIVEEIQQI
ncbi:MAG: UDP-N-acetylmuramoyl-tripeptide--D-alanyl-D-alanine ligase [Parcubacteria group bacterium Gr01-1014_3]|nr:MAG: UDP-N-acetylmuramoyl-tripeptide--D-alanyl-D-alanine ligase [Parcubacteria group bacterium Gr01-1014_3]